MTRKTSARPVGVVLIAGLAWASPARSQAPVPALAAAAPMCATPEQTAPVTAFYEKSAAMLPLLATRTLKMPEALIASALKPNQALGVEGRYFGALWDSARTWGDVVFFASKEGNQFEVNGPLPEGVQSTSSNYFNLGPQKAGITGHLRADRIVSIYAISLQEGKAHLRGLVFYDGKGDSQFAVFLPGEGAPVPPDTEAVFNKTWSMIASLPRVCK